MVSIYDLKPQFQILLRPMVRRLAAAGVTANQVTVAAMVVSFANGLAIFAFSDQRWPLLLVPLILLMRMALNAIDGMLAREHGMKSSVGAILNELGDVISDAALYLPFAFVPGNNPVWVVLVVLLAVLSEMTGVVAVQIGSDRRYDGPMGKSDRAFLFGVVGLLLGVGFSPRPWIDYVFVAAIILLGITIINRARRALENGA